MPNQTVARLGIQVKTEPKCKICSNVNRGEIEDTLVIRARGETLADGVRPTLKWFSEYAPKKWGITINDYNIHTHMSKHFKIGSAIEVNASSKQVVTKKMEALLAAGDIEGVAPEVFLETVVAIAHAKVLADPSSVTLDQGMKAVAELTKRRHDEQTANLMQGLVGAVQKSVLAGRPEPETIVVESVEEIDAPEEEQNSGSEVGRGEGVPSPEPVDLGDESAQDVPSDQEPSVPGLRLSDPGREGLPALLPGNQGEAAELEDVQRCDLPNEEA